MPDSVFPPLETELDPDQEFNAKDPRWWLALIVVILIAASIVAGVVLALRVLWVVGSDPHAAAEFFSSSYLQSSSAFFAAIAAIALVVVTYALVRSTSRLQRATQAQTHAQTAPLMLVFADVYHDPHLEADEPKGMPAYTHEASDVKEQEYKAFLNQATGPKRYLAIGVSNAQQLASFAVATDISIKVTLRFTKLSAVAAGMSGLGTEANSVKIERILKIPALLGKDQYYMPAFRVDPLPFWGFEVERIVYRNFQGHSRGFGVGVKSGTWDRDRGILLRESGKFPPLIGEIPR